MVKIVWINFVKYKKKYCRNSKFPTKINGSINCHKIRIAFNR